MCLLMTSLNRALHLARTNTTRSRVVKQHRLVHPKSGTRIKSCRFSTTPQHEQISRGHAEIQGDHQFPLHRPALPCTTQYAGIPELPCTAHGTCSGDQSSKIFSNFGFPFDTLSNREQWLLTIRHNHCICNIYITTNIYIYMPSSSNSRSSKPQLNAIPVTLQHRHQTDDRRKTVEDNKRSMRNLGTIPADGF